MNLVALSVGLMVILATIGVYMAHRRRFPTRPSAGAEFTVSRPTRWFRYAQIVIYGGALADLPVQALWLEPRGPSGVRLLLGAATSLIGILLLAASLRALGANFHGCHEGKLPSERVQCGPYRVLRHPIYTANMLTMLGLVVLTWSTVMVGITGLLAVFYLFSIRDENRMLAERFPITPHRRR